MKNRNIYFIGFVVMVMALCNPAFIFAAEETSTMMCDEGVVKIGDTEVEAKIKDTGSSYHPGRIKAGFVEIDKPGKYEFSITPIDDGNWKEFRFQGIELKMITPQLSHRPAL